VLNNQGCCHLRQGHRAEAFECFKTALSQIKDVLLVHNGVAAQPLDSSQLRPMTANVLRTSLPTEIWDDAYLRHSESPYFIFTNGIPFIPGHRFSTDFIEEGKVVSATIIFNLAVTTHLQAIDNKGRQQTLKSAQSLYEFTSRLLTPILCKQDRQQGPPPVRNAAFDLLALALLNNTAVIHWECHEFLNAETAFGRLAMFSHSVSSFLLPPTAASTPHPVHQNLEGALLIKVKRMLLNATVGGFASVWASPAA
jgi:hypothetical protein